MKNWSLGRRLFVVLTLLALTSTFSVFGEDDFMEEGMGMGDFKLEKQDVQQMLQMMKQNGMITEEQEREAKKELDSKSDNDLENLRKSAVQRINSGNIPTMSNAPKFESHGKVDKKEESAKVNTGDNGILNNARVPASVENGSNKISNKGPNAEGSEIKVQEKNEISNTTKNEALEKTQKMQNALNFLNSQN